MDKLPIEILEQIILQLPDNDLFNICWVSKVWYQISRHEAYKRWKGYADIIDKIYENYKEIQNAIEENPAEYVCKPILECMLKYQDAFREYTKKHILIMGQMLEQRMIIDPSEKASIERIIHKYIWNDNIAIDFQWEKIYRLMGYNTSSCQRINPFIILREWQQQG